VQVAGRVVPAIVSIGRHVGEGDFTCHAKSKLLALLTTTTPKRPAATNSCVGQSVTVSPELAMLPTESMLSKEIPLLRQ
jgi:hypothetical protein